MLAGHALTYAFMGRSLADGHHAYYASLLQFSTLLLAVCCVVFAARAMTRIGWIAPLQQSILTTWLKLSVGQILLFAVFERFEGYVPAVAGYAAQLLVALFAALAIQYFSRFIARCQDGTREAQSYLRRLLASARGVRLCVRPFEPAYALRVRAGISRFQRPPPQH